ncbi:MAG: histidinol-phosphatase HisJ family protein [Erysipelotrichaceae bacterium]|nr:histidinol-phosphatase HisJ family protein [Erysipelotrichaceae bacterium]
MNVDYHLHSEYSDDSFYDMEELVKDYIKLGINEICFTDHVDYGIKRDHDDPRGFEYFCPYNDGKYVPLSNVDYPNYIKRIDELADKYKDQVVIKKGLELGLQSHRIKEYEELIQKYPVFDFFLLSFHETDDLETWNQDYQKGKSQKEYNEGYYLDMLKTVKNFKNYSALAHMDLLRRYDLEGDYPFELLKPLIEEILKIVIADGKGIEINASSIRYGLKDLTPSRDILKLYRELGGRIITIGSDAHKREHLSIDILNMAKEELKKLGYKEYCTFDKLEPIFHKL